MTIEKLTKKIETCYHNRSKYPKHDPKSRCVNCDGVLSKRDVCVNCGLPKENKRKCSKCKVLLIDFVRLSDKKMGINAKPPNHDWMHKSGFSKSGA